VSLAWSPSTDNVGVTQYRVFRDGMYLAGTSGTDYTDTTPLGGTHSYQVLAVDAAGNLSPLSAPLEVQSVDGNPPTTAGDLSATAAPNAVTLSWAPATDDVGVTGYDVRRDGVVVGTTSQTSWTDHTVLSETTYTYTVVARDAAGNTSAPSASRTVSTPAPTPIVPIADTYARASNPTTNYGRATTLRVDGDPVTNAYLKFTVPAGAGTVRRARLRIWVTAGTSSGVIVRTVGDSSWSETTLNWTNAPAIGSEPVAFSGRTTTGQWVTVDITPAVTTGTFTIALTSNGASSSSYGSRESATPPQLLLDVASG
jgi:chitodextrinase